MTGGLAKRYGRALLEVARDENRLEEVGAELDQVASWLADKELSAALNSPALSNENHHALVRQMTESLGLSELARNFLSLLTDQHRLPYFTAIHAAYLELVDRELNRLRAVLRSARPVSDAQLAEIAAALEKTHGKTILLTPEVDPDLIAGVSVEIEGKIYDGSARTQLTHAARAMSHGEPTG